MKKLLFIAILLITSITASSQIHDVDATANKVAVISVQDMSNNIIWEDCNIPISINTTPGSEKIVIYSKTNKVIKLKSLDKVEYYNGIETIWYYATDTNKGHCKVMIQFLNNNKVAVAVLYPKVSYKYIADLS
jgi:hypothetical protein